MRTPTLRANFASTLLGNLIYLGCQWGMLVTLAKLGSPEMLGQFALGLALTAPVIMLGNLQLRSVQATDARGEFSFSSYFGLRLATTLMALSVIIALACASGYPGQTVLVVLLVGLAKAVESVSDIIYGLFQRHEQMGRQATSMVAKGIISLASFLAGVALSGTVAWGLVGLVISWTTVLIAYDLPQAARFHVEELRSGWQLHVLRRIARLSLPLGIVMMLISLNTNVPRYFVEHYHGQRELGVFAAIAYLPTASATVINALGNTISPRLANYYAGANLRAFLSLLLLASIAASGLALLLLSATALVGGELLSVVYSPQYGAHNDVFLLLVAASGIGFVASLLGFAATAARCFRVQLPLFVCVTATTLAACVFLVPEHGASGAGMAILLSSIVQLVLSAGVIAYAVRGIPKEVPVGSGG